MSGFRPRLTVLAIVLTSLVGMQPRKAKMEETVRTDKKLIQEKSADVSSRSIMSRETPVAANPQPLDLKKIFFGESDELPGCGFAMPRINPEPEVHLVSSSAVSTSQAPGPTLTSRGWPHCNVTIEPAVPNPTVTAIVVEN